MKGFWSDSLVEWVRVRIEQRGVKGQFRCGSNSLRPCPPSLVIDYQALQRDAYKFVTVVSL